MNPASVATAPTVYGIETVLRFCNTSVISLVKVATAPTVYGIETLKILLLLQLHHDGCNSTYRLRY